VKSTVTITYLSESHIAQSLNVIQTNTEGSLNNGAAVWFNFYYSVAFQQERCCSLIKIFLWGLPIVTSEAYIIFFCSNPFTLKFPYPLSTGLCHCCPSRRPTLRLRRARTPIQRPGTIQPFFFFVIFFF